jgi:hypothetical protein
MRVWVSGIVFNPQQAEDFTVHQGFKRATVRQQGVIEVSTPRAPRFPAATGPKAFSSLPILPLSVVVHRCLCSLATNGRELCASRCSHHVCVTLSQRNLTGLTLGGFVCQGMKVCSHKAFIPVKRIVANGPISHLSATFY